jgi:hypothetical protein
LALLIEPLITRIDRPLPSLFVWTLSTSSGSATWALAGGPERPRVALAAIAERPRGEAADPEVRGLREKLESGRVVAVSRARDGSSFVLVVQRGTLRYLATLSARGLSVRPFVNGIDDDGEPMWIADLLAREKIDTGFVGAHRALLLDAERTAARRAIARTTSRLERRLAALHTDGEAIELADGEAQRARLFLAAARQAPSGARSLTVTDWSSGEAREEVFPLRGDRPAYVELEAVFFKAKRLRRGVELAASRASQARQALSILGAALERVAQAGDVAELRRELLHVNRTLPGDVRLERPGASPAAGTKAKVGESSPRRKAYRSFVGTLGVPLLVGKGGADNDELTLHVARPHDHFFHAKDAKGAHVIAQAPSKKSPLDARVVLEGALLAAHFSDRRGEAIVDVQHCERRHLRKRKGAAVGLVELTREKIIAVRADEAILARLLASEDRGEPSGAPLGLFGEELVDAHAIDREPFDVRVFDDHVREIDVREARMREVHVDERRVRGVRVFQRGPFPGDVVESCSLERNVVKRGVGERDVGDGCLGERAVLQRRLGDIDVLCVGFFQRDVAELCARQIDVLEDRAREILPAECLFRHARRLPAKRRARTSAGGGARSPADDQCSVPTPCTAAARIEPSSIKRRAASMSR